MYTHKIVEIYKGVEIELERNGSQFTYFANLNDDLLSCKTVAGLKRMIDKEGE